MARTDSLELPARGEGVSSLHDALLAVCARVVEPWTHPPREDHPCGAPEEMRAWIEQRWRLVVAPMGPFAGDLSIATVLADRDMAHLGSTPQTLQAALANPVTAVERIAVPLCREAAQHCLTRLAAMSPDTRATFWGTGEPMKEWLTVRYPSSRQGHPAPVAVARLHVLIEAIRSRGLCTDEILASVLPLCTAYGLPGVVADAWNKDWVFNRGGPVLVEREDPWLALAARVMSARPTPDSPKQSALRAFVLGQLEHARHRECTLAAELLADTVAEEVGGAAVLPYEALGTFPWAQNNVSDALSPSVSEIEHIIARLPDFPDEAAASYPTVTAQRMARNNRERLEKFIRQILEAPAIRYCATRALWRRYPAAEDRLLIIRYGSLYDQGPWWHVDPPFADELAQTLATEIERDPQSVSFATSGHQVVELVGLVPPATWFRLFSAVDRARATTDCSFTRHQVINYLNAMWQYPGWRPSVEDLAPFLQHAQGEVRQWAQFALAALGQEPARTPVPPRRLHRGPPSSIKSHSSSGRGDRG